MKPKKLTIDLMREIARKREGECLSQEYHHVKANLLWKCKDGHQWWASADNVKNKNTWCRACKGVQKLTLVLMQEIAREQGGKCLSTEYKGLTKKLSWECKLGHQWEAAPHNIRHRGDWCPTCAGKNKLTLEFIDNIAKKRHGKCLSRQYENLDAKLLWECEFGHQWEATGESVVRGGTWCRDCSGSRGELAVRRFFEKIFKQKFPCKRPKWLSKDGGRLELDGYCAELNLAFEYQGLYHYSESAFWYPTNKFDFKKRQELDAFKRSQCKKMGIKLIEINQFDPRLSTDSWKGHIREALIENNIEVPDNFNSTPFGIDDFFASRNLITEANNLALSKGGKCLNKIIFYKMQKVEWQCAIGHIWSASFNSIRFAKSWCPICAGTKKLKIETMHDLAKEREGKCLSSSYINARTKLLWECKDGHQWKATPDEIKNSKSWCSICAGTKKLTIEAMHSLADEKGGKCLSFSYISVKTKLLWECKSGHQWEATPDHIKNKRSWCPTCAGRPELTLDLMKELAAKKGGKCLSSEYIVYFTPNRTPISLLVEH